MILVFKIMNALIVILIKILICNLVDPIDIKIRGLFISLVNQKSMQKMHC